MTCANPAPCRILWRTFSFSVVRAAGFFGGAACSGSTGASHATSQTWHYMEGHHVCNPPCSRTAVDGNGFLVGVPCGFSECQSSVSALLHPLLWVPFLDCAELFFGILGP